MNFIKKEQLKELIDIVFEIQSKSKTQIFVDYSPHVDQVDVRIYEDGWEYGKQSYYLVWSELYSVGKHYRSFEQIKATLEKYIN